MPLAPIIKIERQKWGAMGILQVIYGVILVCKCKLFYDITKKTPHAFVYDSNFPQKEMIECCGAIIDNISHAPICVLEEKYRKTKNSLNTVLKILIGRFNVEFVYKVNTNEI